MGTMSKNNLLGITLGITPILWRIQSLALYSLVNAHQMAN